MILNDALLSEERSSEIHADSDIYDCLIGSWNVRVVDYGENGLKRESRGEWHFARALEGRAIQDVFIVPTRNERNSSTPKERNRYGTSLRTYDSATSSWHITWINPVRQVHNQLVGRKVGNDIIQDGVDEKGALMRWCFRDITANSFLWTGEESNDNGKTWQLGAEFFATRKP